MKMIIAMVISMVFAIPVSAVLVMMVREPVSILGGFFIGMVAYMFSSVWVNTFK